MKKKTAIAAILLLLIAAGVWISARHAAPVSAAAKALGKIENRTGILLVNQDNPLPEDYDPGELVNLYAQKRHFLLANSAIELAKEAFEAANRMFEQAEKEDMNGFILTSGFRSWERQAELYAQAEGNTAQKPGCSEHETGLAFDVTARYDSGSFEDTPQFAWLKEHCWEWGFILRYPKGKEAVTGIDYEPWHYRYVGEEAALRIRERNCTLEEYCFSPE